MDSNQQISETDDGKLMVKFAIQLANINLLEYEKKFWERNKPQLNLVTNLWIGAYTLFEAP